MKFFEFVDNRFQELTYSNQKKFNIYKDAEIKTLNQLLTFYRGTLRWILVPKVLLQYLAVNLALLPKPKTPLLDELKAKAEAAKKPLEAVPPLDAS